MPIDQVKPSFSARSLRIRGSFRRLRRSSGVTLVELMVAVAIVGIGILAMFNAFRYIMTSMAVSQKNSLATNLAQQQIEILKDQGYYALLITTVTPTIPGSTQYYDPNNYPPQTYNVNGQSYTVYTYVTMAQVSNNVIGPASSNYPDTGLKQMTVNVIWMDRGTQQSLTLNNLLENPNVASLDSGISGTVTAQGGGALAGTLVKVDEHPTWFGYANASGQYSFAVSHGSWTVEASSSGYYNAVAPVSCAANSYTNNVNLSLLSVASGTIGASSVWYNQGLVISEVVGTTYTWANLTGGGPFQAQVEYLELFNPTTYQINMSPPSPNNTYSFEYFNINAYNGSTSENDIMANASSCLNSGVGGGVYVSTYVAPGSYYLIANYPKILINGSWVTADAYYNNNHALPHDPNCIADLNWGGLQLKSAGGTVYDQVCWNGNGGPPSQYCNGGTSAYVPMDGTCGLNTGAGGCSGDSTFAGSFQGNQLVRFSSPAVLGRGTFGSAYNSQQNKLDFIYPINGNAATYGLQYAPYTTASSTFPIIAGIPAANAQVAATDLFSSSTQTITGYATSPAPWSQSQPFSSFILVGVSTGVWNVAIASANSANSVQFFSEIDAITVTQNATTMVPNGNTTGAWSSPNVYSVELSSTANVGFIKGQVTDVNLTPLGGIKVQAGGATKNTDSNGLYFMEVSTGTVAMTVNPGNLNAAYVQVGLQATVTSGQITLENFALSKGGIISGYVTTGTTPVPQIVAIALDSNGNQAGQATTDATGHFYMNNVSTGTYTVQLALAAGQSSSPGSTSASITASAPTVFASSFTMTGALATFAGTVSYNSASLVSGALVILSTGAISTPPNQILGSNANTQTPIYAISSLADGTFALPVGANSSPYNVLVSMPIVNPDGTVTMHTNTYAVSISTPSATVTRALTLP